MGTENAELYDLVYGAIKDYSAESEKIEAWIRRFHPAARTLLDVACGTGEHAKNLAHRYEVEGIDLDAGLLELARRKLPRNRFTVADMRSFDLGRRFDVITCLFSSIGYVQRPESLAVTLRNFSSHLNPGGLAIIEPWFTPRSWDAGKLSLQTIDTPELKVARMNSSETLENGLSRVEMNFLVGRPGAAIRSLKEEHVLGLFTREQMESAFKAAGLQVFYDDAGIFGRGLYVGAKST